MDTILHTKSVILGNMDSCHDRIYYSSNENLKSLFSQVSFEGKDVLSVLASGDQVFSIYDKKPKSVDTFDLNILAPYYFYLRKWSILNFDEYYPNVFSNDEILKILNTVTPGDEQEREAYQYWRTYITHFSSFFTKYLFFYSIDPKKNEIENLKNIKERLVKDPFHFHPLDISNEKINQKYDSIVLSNILEYYSMDDKASKRISDHLYHMLSEDGQVIVSYLMNLGTTSSEYYAFRDRFYSFPLKNENGNDIGRIYQKKRC